MKLNPFADDTQCISTVGTILKEHGIEPAPERRKGTSWTDFLKSHWETLDACDYFTTEVWTANGLVTFFVFFIIRLKTRRVHIAGITTSPDSAFMAQVARNLTDHQDGFLLNKTHLLMDWDDKVTEQFRELLKEAGAESVRLPTRSPDLNAYPERFVRIIKDECLELLPSSGVRSDPFLCGEMPLRSRASSARFGFPRFLRQIELLQIQVV